MKSAKELKKEIRELKKIKNSCRPRSEERISLHRKIKELKQLLISIQESNKEKEPLITQILELNPLAKYVDLNKYTIEQLQIHLTKVKEKKCIKI